MQPFDAIIFDLDGTLVDSLGDIAHALNTALARLNRAAVEPSLVRTWIGDGMPALCQRAAEHAECEEHAARLLQLAREAYDRCCVDRTACFPNVLKMLDLLHRAGVPMAVLSNKPHALTQCVIDALALRSYFVECVGYLSEAEKKPSPDHALRLAAAMSASHARVLIVGDSLIDIATARNAGMVAGAVTWGYQDRQDLATAAPDYFFSEPLEIFFRVRGQAHPESA